MAATIRLTTVDAGPLTLAKGILLSMAQGTITIPTAVWIIEHPKHGPILFDTGVNYNVADPEAAERYWGPGLREAFGAQNFTRQHAVDEQLKKLGYSLNDVKFVIYSHLHLDHAGGMCHFPNATHVVQRDELRYAWWPDSWTGAVYCFNDIKDQRKFNFLELNGDTDLFADGTFQLIRTPGHTPGHQALLLRLHNRGQICLAADTSHLKEAYRQMAPMPWDWNVEALSLSYMRIQALERAGVPIFFSHDPEDFASLPRDGEYWD
ncbi:MAG: N-acyl homoserine lactonase family protein [Ktedonobacteraceae bacterium]|nr:N-acyl homoserine lactonase family protein [Ktedonobacteraceae bacterium]